MRILFAEFSNPACHLLSLSLSSPEKTVVKALREEGSLPMSSDFIALTENVESTHLSSHSLWNFLNLLLSKWGIRHRDRGF
ncbi:unnamed protein product [Citrullus colocynthis]|uniref:Uncharacterized protein n=1 Tax=Citrullus colocynthis TaxID=252529 RepID=A0ABP0Y9U4_9ROSI